MATQLVVSASCGIEGTRVVAYKPLLDEAIRLSQHKVSSVLLLVMFLLRSRQPPATILVQRAALQAQMDPSRDIEWKQALHSYGYHQSCTSVDATDPLYVIYGHSTGNYTSSNAL